MAADYNGAWEPEADYTGHQWFTVRFCCTSTSKLLINILNLRTCRLKLKCVFITIGHPTLADIDSSDSPSCTIT